MAKHTTAKSFSLLTGITIVEKIIAFVFEALIATILGTNFITDSYFTASEFFTLIDTAFLSSLTIVALNRFSFYSNNGDESKAFKTLSELLSFYLPLVVLLSAVVFCFSSPLTFIIAPGFEDDARKVLVRCIRIMAIIPVIVCVTSVAQAILRQKKKYGITGLRSLFISVVGIIGLCIFSSPSNADVLSLSFIVSNILYCIMTVLLAGKYGKLKFQLPVYNDEVKHSLKMIFPLMVSYGISRIALMIDKIIASMLGEGNVSALTYAHSLYNVVSAVFVVNLSTILLTDFNQMIVQKDYNAISRKIKSVVSVMTLLLIPISVVSVVCGKSIVKIVYERGAFSATSTALVASTLSIYVLNFVPSMMHGVFNQVLYAQGNTKAPMWISAIAIVSNFSISLPMINVVGLPGVAIGTVISTIISLVISIFVIKKTIPQIVEWFSLKMLGEFLISSGVCAIVALIAYSLLSGISSVLTFAFTTAIVFLVDAILLCSIKNEYILQAIHLLKTRLSGKE